VFALLARPETRFRQVRDEAASRVKFLARQVRISVRIPEAQDVRLWSATVRGRDGCCMADLEQRPNRLSLWVAILTALMAVILLAMAITTLPRSGPAPSD
jgi:hypothetical protein